ncbi:pantothenate transporter [Coniochaeta sp. 2T2.1]|nr:pantothenate transporter [Coniochaeta sp. 2T2.1]
MTSFSEKTHVVDEKTGSRIQEAPAYQQTHVVDTYSEDEPVTASPAPPPARQKFWHYFSPEDTPAERRLILKLDGLIMVFLFLAYWGKVLDSSATGTAYVSGMKEDLRMFGNELNYLNTVYLCGFITLQIPMTMLMTRFSVNYFLPAADLLWGIFTLVQYTSTSVKQLYAFRFLVGMLGGFFFPAAMWYMGCWYKRNELSRRGAFFFIASQVGGMSSGYIQAGAYAHLNGVHGIEGWRWLYIICFAATIPIAFVGFIFLPGTPDRPNLRFLTADDIALARARMASEHRQPRQKITIKIIRNVVFKGWHFWVLVAFAFFFSQADGVTSNSGLPLWLKQQGYGVEAINTITTASPAVTIVSSIVWGIVADAYDAKGPLIGLTAALNIFACVCLAIWDVPVGLKFFAFYLTGTANAIASIIYSWANEICAGNAEERALVISTMNTIGNAFGAWLPIFVWKTVDAPRYLVGYNWTIALNVCMVSMLFVLSWFWNREQREAREAESPAQGSPTLAEKSSA